MAKKSFKKGVRNIIEPANKDQNNKSPQKSDNKSTARKTKPRASSRKKPVVNLGDSFVVQNAGTAKQKLNEALKSKDEVEITSAEINEIDISFIQLLMAFDKEAEKRKMKINWNIRFAEDTKSLLQHTGMCHILSNFEASNN